MIKSKLIDSVDKSLQVTLNYLNDKAINLEIFLRKFDEVRKVELQRNLVESRVLSVNQQTKKSTPTVRDRDRNQASPRISNNYKDHSGDSSFKGLKSQLESQKSQIE